MCDCIFTDTHSLFILCQDGTVVVHTVRRGLFLRTLRPPSDSCVPAQISALQVGMEGHIVVQTSQDERSNRKVCECIQCTGIDTLKKVSQPPFGQYSNSTYSYRASTPFMCTP